MACAVAQDETGQTLLRCRVQPIETVRHQEDRRQGVHRLGRLAAGEPRPQAQGMLSIEARSPDQRQQFVVWILDLGEQRGTVVTKRLADGVQRRRHRGRPMSAATEPAPALGHALAHLGLLGGVEAVVEIGQGVDHLGAAHLQHAGLFVQQTQRAGAVELVG